MNISDQTIIKFQKKILSRYALHKRDLPWRDSFNPYRVFVSEVMSQQTQVMRVIPKFFAFCEELPTIHDLAECDTMTLLRLRSWLWFNSRAVRLQQAAKIIVEKYNWIVPDNREHLLELPWIWPYTSASICAFAYNLAEPVVDTNIRRVLIHELWLDHWLKTWSLEWVARRCIPDGQSNDRHNALMDYGSLVATAKATWIRPLSKQSTFNWSDRQVRWWILKQLVVWKPLTLDKVWEQFPKKEVKSIVRGMVKEGLVSESEMGLMIKE